MSSKKQILYNFHYIKYLRIIISFCLRPKLWTFYISILIYYIKVEFSDKGEVYNIYIMKKIDSHLKYIEIASAESHSI